MLTTFDIMSASMCMRIFDRDGHSNQICRATYRRYFLESLRSGCWEQESKRNGQSWMNNRTEMELGFLRQLDPKN